MEVEMDIAKRFEELIKDTPQKLDKFIDNIEATDYGCHYRFDGFMYCAIVYQDGKYYDVGDIHPGEPFNWDLSKCSHFDTLEELVVMMRLHLTL